MDASKYSFKSQQDGSSITVSIDAYCERPTACDFFMGFGIGQVQYLTFAGDLDGGITVGVSGRIFVYPSCGMNIANGDISKLISDTVNYTNPRDTLAGGDRNNWYSISGQANGYNVPLTFEFINNDILDTFTFNFTSPKFPNGKYCQFNSSVATGQDFKVFITMDPYNDETILVTSFSGRGYVTYNLSLNFYVH